MPEVPQYVNVNPASAAQRQGIAANRAGRDVTVQYTVNPAVAGKLVRFQLQPDPGNLSDQQQQALRRFDDERATLTKQIGLTNDQGVATATLQLSAFAGDKFGVRAWEVGEGDVEGPPHDLPDTYVVTKRVYYQVTTYDGTTNTGWLGRTGQVAAVAAPNMANVAAEFSARNKAIDLVAQAPTRAHITRRANIVTSTDRTMLSASGLDGYDATREPIVVKVVLLPQLNTPREISVEFQNLAANVASVQNLAHRLWIDLSKPVGTDWLVSLEWCWQSGDLLWKALEPTAAVATGAQQITITVPPRDARLLSSDTNIMVKVTYRYASSDSEGALSLEGSNCVWVPLEEMGAHGAAGANAIAAGHVELLLQHEIGHVFGMVPDGHAHRYTGHGHVGPHCAHGLSAPQKQQARYTNLPGDCVMFGGPSPANPVRFCDDCDAALRSKPLRNLGNPR